MTIQRVLFLFLVVAVAAGAFAADDPAALNRAAVEAYTAKQYAASADLFAKAIAAGAKDVTTLYNAACSSALAGRTDAAFDLLRQAIAAGYSDAAHLKSDSDLASLRADARWAALLSDAEKAAQRKDRLWSSEALNTAYAPALSEDERVAGLSRIWSEAKFDFAYWDKVPDLDWDASYLAYLPKVRAAASTTDYYKLLLQFLAQLKDGHTNVTPPLEVRRQLFAEPALRLGEIEGKILVTDVFDPSLGIARGTELTEIDGTPVRQYVNGRVAPWQSASTPQGLAVRMWRRALWGSERSTVDVTLVDAAGKTTKKTLHRLTLEEGQKLAPATEPFEYRLLPGNVAYVALNAFDDMKAADAFEAKFDEIAKSDALILDVRRNGGGNSGVGYRVLSMLTAKAFFGSKWSTRDYKPTYRAWGRPEEKFEGAAAEIQPDRKHLYTKPVVVLTGPKTFSAAEDFAVAFDAMKRGSIIGEPTGGSTGQPLPFKLPGGGSARICTKRDTYPDGREFVGVGIQPQMVVRTKLADFRAGRDTQLDAAVASLKPAAFADGRRYTWNRLATAPYKGKQDDIFFVNPEVGWYVNGDGYIYKTTDGGRTWTEKLHKPGTYFRCIGFVDEQRGFAGNIGLNYFPGVTDATPLYETRDGGDTWTAVTNVRGPMPTGLCSIDVERVPFINAGVLDHKVRIYAGGRVGGPAFLMTSMDGGESWVSADVSPFGAMILDVKFLDDKVGFLSSGTNADIAQSHALILRTDDGGQTWRTVYESARPYEITWKSSFPSRNVGYVTIQSYDPDRKVTQRYVAKTADGGRTWSELPVSSDFAFREFGIAFRDEKVGWIGGSTTGLETRDGGRTWTPIAFGRAVNKIRVLREGDTTVAYAIGTDVYKLERQ